MYSVILGSSDGGGGGGAAIFQLAFFGLIFVAMYFLLIRPQRRRAREAATLQSQLAEGDEVLLSSGLFGFVDGIEGDQVWVEIADNVTVRALRSAIVRRTTPADVPAADAATEPVPDATEPADDDTDDK